MWWFLGDVISDSGDNHSNAEIQDNLMVSISPGNKKYYIPLCTDELKPIAPTILDAMNFYSNYVDSASVGSLLSGADWSVKNVDSDSFDAVQVIFAFDPFGLMLTQAAKGRIRKFVVLCTSTNIFRYINHPEAVAGAIQRLWPIFKAIFDIRAWDMRTMESLCKACKYAVRTSGRFMGITIGAILQEIQALYHHHQQPCFLYLSSEVIKIWGLLYMIV